jgi:hypothetical protein
MVRALTRNGPYTRTLGNIYQSHLRKMTELKYFFLKTKLENPDKELDAHSFFELIKHKISWKEYLSFITEFTNNNSLNTEGKYSELTELGKLRLLEFESNFIQTKKDENAERKKLHNESVISEWKRKTFWHIFTLGLLSGIYSTYDFFIKNPKTEERFQKIESDILKNKDTIKELRTLVLTRKNLDSLNHSNSELNKKSE